MLQELRADDLTVQTLVPQETANPDAILAEVSHLSNIATLLVVDSYIPNLYNADFQNQIRRSGMKLMMITIRNDTHFVADIVHNQNLLALKLDYSVESYTKLLLGPRYAIIDDSFMSLSRKRVNVSQRVDTILLSFGGSDRTNRVRKSIMALDKMKNAPQRIIVVVGSLYANLDDLKELITQESHLNVELHVNTSEMPALMAQSDLAITSGGLTVWELACIGVPNIIISTSEHERQSGLLLNESGVCYYLGHQDHVLHEQIICAVELLMSDEERRQAMALCSKRLVDGMGGQRVMNHIIEVLQGEQKNA